MDQDVRSQAIDLYDRFTHEGLDRRVFMARMVALAGSVAAAEALIGAIAASPAAAAIIPADDPRLTTRTQDLGGGYKAYVAEPRSRSLKATVMVIHENRGLNEHIKDVARRFGIAGLRAVAPDFLSLSGGTPANEDAAREAIGKLDLGRSVVDTAGIILDELSASSRNGKVGAVGFCWGGGFVNRLAVAAGSKLDAGVVYYGPAPSPAEAARVEALRAAKKPVKFYLYDGVTHAFNNDTSAERYNKAAADLAWDRTLAFFRKYLG